MKETVKLIVTADAAAGAPTLTIPALGVRVQAVPGRTTESWLIVSQVGNFFGEATTRCREADVDIPIAVRSMDDADYRAWLAAR